MPLQISAFKTILDDSRGGKVQIPDGAPTDVTPASFTGNYTVPDGCRIVRFKGTGTVTWPTDATPEGFDGIEFRGVRPGQVFAVA